MPSPDTYSVIQGSSLPRQVALRCPDGYYDVRASPDRLERAKRLFDLVAARCRAAGWAVYLRERDVDGEAPTNVDVDGVRVDIAITEQCERVKGGPKRPAGMAADVLWKGVLGWNWRPTGKLMLEIRDNMSRRCWHDGANRRAEDLVPEFVDAIAAEAKERREARAAGREPEPDLSVYVSDPPDVGAVLSRSKKYLDVTASPKQLARANAVFEKAIARCAARGWSVHLRTSGHRAAEPTCVRIGKDNVHVGVTEVCNVVGKGRGRYVPTGRLSLEIRDPNTGSRTCWLDGNGRRVEDLIDSFADGLMPWLDQKATIERAVANIVESQRKRQQDENQQREDLQRRARDWDEVVKLRTLIAAASERGVPRRWIVWATSRADAIEKGVFDGLGALHR